MYHSIARRPGVPSARFFVLTAATSVMFLVIHTATSAGERGVSGTKQVLSESNVTSYWPQRLCNNSRGGAPSSLRAGRMTDEKAQEIKRLQGTWLQESFVLNGRRSATHGRVRLTFHKKTLTWTFRGSRWPLAVSNMHRIRNQFDLDLSSKPKRLIEKITGPPFGGRTETKSYRLIGDRLELSFRVDGNDAPPKNFDAGLGSGLALVRFKRATQQK